MKIWFSQLEEQILSKTVVKYDNTFLRLRPLYFTADWFKVLFSSKSTKIPENKLKNVISANHQPENGTVYDKKPFKLPLEAGKLTNF